MIHSNSIGIKLALLLTIVLIVSTVAAEGADPPAMRILQTESGTRFGMFGEKPNSPAPTLFVFATSVDDMDEGAIYTETGRQLAKQGWLYVTLDPPCHGRDSKEGEPPTLSGWAHRVKNGEELMKPFVTRCRDVLDWLVAERYTDPDKVAAGGTSRGGFCALHFTAAEPRVKAVVCISPVTNPLALREFAGVKPEQTARINAKALADELAGRPIWMSVGNDDKRVGTDHCISTCRRFVAASRQRKPDAVAPVELIIAPSNGHTAVDNAYMLAAEFVSKQIPPAGRAGAESKDLQIDAEFPGGNILVDKIQGDTVFLHQDPRDTPRFLVLLAFPCAQCGEPDADLQVHQRKRIRFPGAGGQQRRRSHLAMAGRGDREGELFPIPIWGRGQRDPLLLCDSLSTEKPRILS